MSERFQLILPFAGSASLAYFLLGATRAVVPYQGSKWRVRRQLVEIMGELGYRGVPSSFTMTDPGPWGITHRVLLNYSNRLTLIRYLRNIAQINPREFYEWAKAHPFPYYPSQGVSPRFNRIAFAATHLALQRISFSGKAVGYSDRWQLPGYNKTSAEGKEASESFGPVRPQIPAMIENLERLHQQLPELVSSDVRHEEARLCELTRMLVPTLVYLDPPYVGMTSYPNGSPVEIDEVFRLADSWVKAGAAVMVSESREIRRSGWITRQIRGRTNGSSPFRTKGDEWVMYRRPEPVDLYFHPGGDLSPGGGHR